MEDYTHVYQIRRCFVIVNAALVIKPCHQAQTIAIKQDTF